MITGMFSRTSLPLSRILSTARTFFDSSLSHRFTSAATGVSVERNLVGSRFNSASSDVSPRIRSEPSIDFPVGIAVQGYASTRDCSVGGIGDLESIGINDINTKKSEIPISLSRKAIANQKKAEEEESTSKIKGTKICIAIRSFDNLEKQAWCLPPHTRKVAMPDTRVLYTVLRSPHVDKKSREQFEMRFKKRFLVIKAQSHELSKKLFWLKRYRILGAQYELQFHCKTRLDMTPVLGNIKDQ